jgi:hypothetical protein
MAEKSTVNLMAEELELFAEEMPEQLNYAAAASTVASAFCGASFACAGSCGSSFSTASSLSTAG